MSKAVAVVDEVQGVTRRFYELLSAPRALRMSARGQALRMAEALRRQRLAEVSVQELRTRLPKGTRFPAGLAQHYRSIAELVTAEAGELCAVPGVGPKSAVKILTAARELAEEVAETVTVRLDDPGADRAALAQLVTTLSAIRRADEVVPDVAGDLRGWDRRVRPVLAEAEVARSWWTMLWSRRQRHAARQACSTLAGVLDEPGTGQLRARVEELLPGVRPSAASAWREYEQDPDGFAALLACVGGSVCAGNPKAAEGYLSDELRQAISATEVDTSLMKATLKPYQVFGTKFILRQERTILGDEMGLGKTMQALAAACHVLAADERARVLVIAPAAVLWNWVGEITEHTRLRPQVGHGPDRDSAVFRWRRRGGILVTTFGTLGKLKLTGTALTIVDEAHYAKNAGTQRSRATVAATRQAERVLFLTGTPMENHAGEFANLVSYLDTKVDVLALADKGKHLAGKFRELVGEVYLRRNQADVLHDLPKAICKVEYVTLGEQERARHDAATDQMRRRQSTFGPAKLARLRELIQKAKAEDRKVIVFSYFRTVLAQIGKELGELAMGPISGSVSPRKRQELVEAFTARKGSSVLLAQIGAGGTGLNIQAASMVILVEPQWTPSIEEQAIARAARNGQTRQVLAFRLVALDSIDMDVRAVQLGKASDFELYARESVAAQCDAATATETVPA